MISRRAIFGLPLALLAPAAPAAINPGTLEALRAEARFQAAEYNKQAAMHVSANPAFLKMLESGTATQALEWVELPL